jgi:hypothetical protein
MTDSDLKRLNRVLAQELGRAPNGWPLFKWERPRDLWYLIEYGVDDITPAGLYVTIDRYKKVPWSERLGPQFPWILANWMDPGTPQEWHMKYGDVIPYPPNGMYYPLYGSQIPCDPNDEITAEAICKITAQRSDSFETHLQRSIDADEFQQAAAQAAMEDRIESDWPAFNCEVTVPGHRFEET